MNLANRGHFLGRRGLPAVLVLLGVLSGTSVRGADRPDMIVADFEGDTYGGWIDRR